MIWLAIFKIWLLIILMLRYKYSVHVTGLTPAFELEDDFFPQADWFIDLYHERIAPIAGYTPKHNFTDGERLRRSKLGV